MSTNQKSLAINTNRNNCIQMIGVMCLLFTPLTLNAKNLDNEPKEQQKLYKCFDREILKLSKEKKKESSQDIYSKCSNQLNKWLSLLPEESHATFLNQLSESLSLALEAAEKGQFVVDEG